jgi:hypothetical protein
MKVAPSPLEVKRKAYDQWELVGGHDRQQGIVISPPLSGRLQRIAAVS